MKEDPVNTIKVAADEFQETLGDEPSDKTEYVEPIEKLQVADLVAAAATAAFGEDLHNLESEI